LVDDLDVGLTLELGDGLVADVVGPVIDIQDLLFGPGRCTMPTAASGRAQREPCGRGD
jgi:hypothetical protein